jgi:tetratricopeptide (TPR) repeat protein
LDDSLPEPRFDLGFIYYLQGRYKAAARSFDIAAEINPDYAEAWAFWGEALEKTGQDGRRALETALRLNPDSLTAAGLMALYQRARGRPQEALVYFYRAARADPENPLWEIEIGATLAQMSDLSAALEHYRRGTALSPEDPLPWRALAEFCLQYGVELKETALPAARRSLLLAPDEAASPELLGRVYLRLGDLDSARRFARRALSLDAGCAPAYLDLGLIAALQGDEALSRRMFRTVIDLAPRSPWAAQARRLMEP